MHVWQISFVPGRGAAPLATHGCWGATPLSTQSPPPIPDPLDLLTSLADSRSWESLVYGTKGSPWRLVCLKSRRKTPSWWSRRTSASCSMVARCATVPVRGCTSKRSPDAAGTQDWYAIRVLAPYTSAGARRGAGRDPRLSLCNGEQGAVHQRPHGGAAGQVRISARHRVCQRWGGHRCGWCEVGVGELVDCGACTTCPCSRAPLATVPPLALLPSLHKAISRACWTSCATWSHAPPCPAPSKSCPQPPSWPPPSQQTCVGGRMDVGPEGGEGDAPHTCTAASNPGPLC